jgi:hypothetical protein
VIAKDIFRTAAVGVLLLGALTPRAFAGEDKTKTYYGDSAVLGGARLFTYVTVEKREGAPGNHKVPVELGVEMPAGALAHLPAEGSMQILYFPNQARNMEFQYMMLDWNPQGHPPDGVYTLPHFDFHFYMQDLDDVMAIGPEDYETSRVPVPPQFMPAGYIDVGAFEPQMGNHLIDPSSPEFNGQTFSRTFLYGAFDGKITFYEPMITLASLTGTPNQCVALKLPQAWAESGYYPTGYCTSYDKARRVYRVFLKDFVYRTAPVQ